MGLKLKAQSKEWLATHQKYVVCMSCALDMDLVNGPYGIVYKCRGCGLRHGAHQATGEPLGTPAGDAETRQARVDAHEALDALWRGPDAPLSRDFAYAWLASKLNLAPSECHIGKFDYDRCCRAIFVCERFGVDVNGKFAEVIDGRMKRLKREMLWND